MDNGVALQQSMEHTPSELKENVPFIPEVDKKYNKT